jgi:hypothetical protein
MNTTPQPETQPHIPISPPTEPTLPDHPRRNTLYIILALLLFLVGVFLFWNTKNHPYPPSQIHIPTPTVSRNVEADWKLYTNTVSGYTLNIPKNWGASETANRIDFVLLDQTSQPIPTEEEYLSIETFLNRNDMTGDEYTLAEFIDTVENKDCTKKNKESLEIKPYTIATYSGLSFIGTCKDVVGNYPGLQIFLSNNSYIYKISPHLTKQNTKVLESVLSSLQLINTPATTHIIPAALAKSLPQKTDDGNEITYLSLFGNKQYVLFITYVKERGAGKEYDYWVYSLASKEKINISSLIKRNEEYKKMYKDMQSLDVYLVFSDWDTDQPLFSVVDGWSVVNGTWKYNALTKEFTSTVH